MFGFRSVCGLFDVKRVTNSFASQIHPGLFDKDFRESGAVGSDKTELVNGKGLMTPIIKSLLRFMCNFTNLIYNMAVSCHD